MTASHRQASELRVARLVGLTRDTTAHCYHVGRCPGLPDISGGVRSLDLLVQEIPKFKMPRKE